PLGQSVAGVWMVGFELDIPADAVRDVDQPAVGARRYLLTGVQEDLVARGFAQILEVDAQSRGRRTFDFDGELIAAVGNAGRDMAHGLSAGTRTFVVISPPKEGGDRTKYREAQTQEQFFHRGLRQRCIALHPVYARRGPLGGEGPPLFPERHPSGRFAVADVLGPRRFVSDG